MEYKAIDYESFKSLEHEIDPDYAAHLGLTRGRYDDGVFKFSDPLVCNGGVTKGYYQVSGMQWLPRLFGRLHS